MTLNQPEAEEAKVGKGNKRRETMAQKKAKKVEKLVTPEFDNIVLPKVKKVFPKIVKASIELTDGKWLSKVFIEKEGSIKRSKLSFDGKLSPKEAIDKLMAMV